MGPKGVPDTKTDRATDRRSIRQLNSTQLNSFLRRAVQCRKLLLALATAVIVGFRSRPDS
jgi:hypothetical protein